MQSVCIYPMAKILNRIRLILEEHTLRCSTVSLWSFNCLIISSKCSLSVVPSDQDIIDVTNNTRHSLQNLIHGSLKHSWGGCCTKWKQGTLIQTKVSVDSEIRYTSLISLSGAFVDTLVIDPTYSTTFHLAMLRTNPLALIGDAGTHASSASL